MAAVRHGHQAVQGWGQPDAFPYAFCFCKMHGCHNDYVVVDQLSLSHLSEAIDWPSVTRRLSSRHTGIGSDGVIVLTAGPIDTDCRMHIFNADGSEAEMCGNGIRCVARYLWERSIASVSQRIATLAGVREIHVSTVAGSFDSASVNMGASLISDTATIVVADREFSVTHVTVGNPHCVIFLASGTDLATFDVARFGPLIEKHTAFAPEGVNVEFTVCMTRDLVSCRTWERGSAETQACGTGAAAVAFAGVHLGKTERHVRVQLLGGELRLEVIESSDGASVSMSGGAEKVFAGSCTVNSDGSVAIDNHHLTSPMTSLCNAPQRGGLLSLSEYRAPAWALRCLQPPSHRLCLANLPTALCVWHGLERLSNQYSDVADAIASGLLQVFIKRDDLTGGEGLTFVGCQPSLCHPLPLLPLLPASTLALV